MAGRRRLQQAPIRLRTMGRWSIGLLALRARVLRADARMVAQMRVADGSDVAAEFERLTHIIYLVVEGTELSLASVPLASYRALTAQQLAGSELSSLALTYPCQSGV